MDISYLNTNILANTAILALKSAYESCSDTAARKSIITAFKAIIQLNHALDPATGITEMTENDNDCDPSEYCAAV